MEGWNVERLEGRKVERLESQKVGRLEGWNAGRLESCKVRQLAKSVQRICLFFLFLDTFGLLLDQVPSELSAAGAK